jgi:branched-chain amino acid transport system substrate-binding protein
MDRSKLLHAAGVSVGAMLAGCSSESDGNPDNTVTETPTTTPERVLRDVDTVRIGLLARMGLPEGAAMQNGAQLAAQHLNENAAGLNAEVKIQSGDIGDIGKKASSEHQRLVTEEDCDLTIGDLGSGFKTRRTMGSIANSETMHITTASIFYPAGKLVSRTTDLTGDGGESEYEQHKYHFRAGPLNLVWQARALAEFVETAAPDSGWERVAVLTETVGELDPYHEQLLSQIESMVDVRITERVGGVADWSPFYNSIEDKDCDLALVGLLLFGTSAVNQWAEQDRQFELGGVLPPAKRPDFWEETDGNAEYVFTTNAMTPRTKNTEQTQPFVDRYVDSFDIRPHSSAAITYDAVLLAVAAIRMAAAEAGRTTIPDSETVVSTLAELSFTEGTVAPTLQFTPPDATYAHEPQWMSMAESDFPVIQQWQAAEDGGGAMHAVAPADSATAAYAFPEWLEK